jgi:hypothetical protein
MCHLIQPHSLYIQFLFVSTNLAVWLTLVHGSPQTTLPLALLQGVTPAHSGLAPFGTFISMNYIYHSRHTQRVDVMWGKYYTSLPAATVCTQIINFFGITVIRRKFLVQPHIATKWQLNLTQCLRIGYPPTDSSSALKGQVNFNIQKQSPVINT